MARRQLQLISAGATAAEGKMGPEDGLSNARSMAIFVEFGAGTSAGSVVIEAAHSKSYAGTWANLATIAWAAASRVHQAYIPGPQIAIRVRVVSVTGGTVNAHAVSMD